MICNWELGLLGTHFEKCRSRAQTLLADGERADYSTDPSKK